MNEFLNKLANEFETPFHNSVLIFSVILLIILLSPIILRRLRIPGIIGLIISGVAIGPNGFNLLENNSAVKLFSTIGLLYIMFIAGLELNLKDFAKNKYKSLIFGFFTFALPLALGYPVCRYLLGYDFSTSLLVASMFATHTLVAYPIVSRLGIVKNEAVAITVGGTILTDTAVLLMLAVISTSASTGLTEEFWWRMGISLLVFLGMVVFAVPRLAAWFFKKLESEKNSHFIFVLSMVFFCAFMAEIAGLEPIIGAFAAGLALNKLIPHTSTLMNRIEFVGNSLFIPFFLISVGMIIDVRVLLNGPTALIVAFSLTAVALLTKYLAAWVTSLLIRASSAQRNLIFGLSSAHAAATLAIILVGHRLGIIDDNILNGTIILILVTCMVASFATENAAKKVALQNKDAFEQIDTGTDQKIMLPISNAETIERLLDIAITIKKPKNPFPIFCLSVVEDDNQAQQKLVGAKKMLEKGQNHAAAADQRVELITTIDQNVPSGIKRVAKEIFATEIIIGVSQKKNWADILFGKHVQNIVEQNNQTIFDCNIALPLNIHKKIVVVCAEHAEKEFGFTQWTDSVLRIADSLSLSVVFYCTSHTYKEVRNRTQKNKLSVKTNHKEFNTWEDFLIISRDIQEQDLIIAIMARKGGISFNTQQNNIPQKLAKHFKNQSYIVIYPTVSGQESFTEYANQYDGGLIEKSVSQLTEGARVVSKIFRKGDKGEAK